MSRPWYSQQQLMSHSPLLCVQLGLIEVASWHSTELTRMGSESEGTRGFHAAAHSKTRIRFGVGRANRHPSRVDELSPLFEVQQVWRVERLFRQGEESQSHKEERDGTSSVLCDARCKTIHDVTVSSLLRSEKLEFRRFRVSVVATVYVFT